MLYDWMANPTEWAGSVTPIVLSMGNPVFIAIVATSDSRIGTTDTATALRSNDHIYRGAERG